MWLAEATTARRGNRHTNSFILAKLAKDDQLTKGILNSTDALSLRRLDLNTI